MGGISYPAWTVEAEEGQKWTIRRPRVRVKGTHRTEILLRKLGEDLTVQWALPSLGVETSSLGLMHAPAVNLPLSLSFVAYHIGCQGVTSQRVTRSHASPPNPGRALEPWDRMLGGETATGGGSGAPSDGRALQITPQSTVVVASRNPSSHPLLLDTQLRVVCIHGFVSPKSDSLALSPSYGNLANPW